MRLRRPPWLRSLRALAKHPFVHIGRALDEFNAFIFAANQEPNHPEIHQGDFAQIQNSVSAATTHCRSNAGDKVRLNSPDQPQSGHASIRVFLNPQHLVLFSPARRQWFGSPCQSSKPTVVVAVNLVRFDTCH
jgi:hypothetical protein